MEKRQVSLGSGRTIQSVDIVLVEREARRLRAQYLATLLRGAADWFKRAVAPRPHRNLGGSARPSPG
ncbi:MAG: hypothetical protein EPO27_00260 [Betaproteobacteria bacterium]|nr:MAG: hypothetical protein EPO27_00260 [Betaproteobacteria bacterium]